MEIRALFTKKGPERLLIGLSIFAQDSLIFKLQQRLFEGINRGNATLFEIVPLPLHRTPHNTQWRSRLKIDSMCLLSCGLAAQVLKLALSSLTGWKNLTYARWQRKKEAQEIEFFAPFALQLFVSHWMWNFSRFFEKGAERVMTFFFVIWLFCTPHHVLFFKRGYRIALQNICFYHFQFWLFFAILIPRPVLQIWIVIG